MTAFPLAADESRGGARKVALLLHSMAPADRRWMLAQCAQEQRRTLEALLAELAGLGFPADAELLQQALTPAGADGDGAQTGPDPLGALSGEQAARLLADEPDRLVAILLEARDWPWAKAMRARWGAARTLRLAALTPTGATPALVDAVLKAVRDAAASATVDSGAPR